MSRGFFMAGKQRGRERAQQSLGGADHPLFTPLDQPRIGEYLAPGLPISIDGTYPPAVAAPALGDDTTAVRTEWLAVGADEVSKMVESGTVATGHAE